MLDINAPPPSLLPPPLLRSRYLQLLLGFYLLHKESSENIKMKLRNCEIKEVWFLCRKWKLSSPPNLMWYTTCERFLSSLLGVEETWCRVLVELIVWACERLLWPTWVLKLLQFWVGKGEDSRGALTIANNSGKEEFSWIGFFLADCSEVGERWWCPPLLELLRGYDRHWGILRFRVRKVMRILLEFNDLCLEICIQSIIIPQYIASRFSTWYCSHRMLSAVNGEILGHKRLRS